MAALGHLNLATGLAEHDVVVEPARRLTNANTCSQAAQKSHTETKPSKTIKHCNPENRSPCRAYQLPISEEGSANCDLRMPDPARARDGRKQRHAHKAAAKPRL